MTTFLMISLPFNRAIVGLRETTRTRESICIYRSLLNLLKKTVLFFVFCVCLFLCVVNMMIKVTTVVTKLLQLVSNGELHDASTDIWTSRLQITRSRQNDIECTGIWLRTNPRGSEHKPYICFI